MELRIITLPFDDNLEGFDDEVVAKFCINKKVHNIHAEFFTNNNKKYWSVAIQYETVLNDSERLTEFNESQKAFYQKLREWRRKSAEKEGFPVYLICRNVHLEEIVRNKPKSLEELKQIKGFGKSKLQKFGKDIIHLVKLFYENTKEEQQPKQPQQ
ncbi:MAG: HRDC domain-containing protein [Candidatus Brocadia sp.]|nr:HRDC domain-containing protein [Candidatus Brocadia sp.]